MASQQGRDRSGGINWGAVGAIAGVIAAIAGVIGFSGSSKKPEVPTVPTVPPALTTSMGTTGTTETTPTATGPKEVCHNEVILEGDNSYNLNECKASQEGTMGILDVGRKALEAGTTAKLAEWTGHDPPSASDCSSSAGASGVGTFKLKRVGQWLCAETETDGNEHRVIRIRFDSYTPPANPVIQGGVYKFFVDVYEPGEG
jgi:hypothetical protein